MIVLNTVTALLPFLDLSVGFSNAEGSGGLKFFWKCPHLVSHVCSTAPRGNFLILQKV